MVDSTNRLTVDIPTTDGSDRPGDAASRDSSTFPEQSPSSSSSAATKSKKSLMKGILQSPSALMEKIGGDSLDEMLPRFESLRGARLDDLIMQGESHVFWPEDG